MKAIIKDGNLVVTIPLTEAHPSKSGWMMLVASSLGWKETEAKVDGKPIRINLNAGYYKE